MKMSVSVLSFILALAVFTGCTLQNVQPADVPPPTTASVPYVVLDRPDTLYFLIDYETYFVPDIRDAVFFVEGAWYLHYGDRWYRGRSFNGPWVYIGRGGLPSRLDRLPSDYRSKRYRKQRVPYGHWNQERERDRPRPPVVRIQRPEHLFLLVRYGVYYVPDKQNEIFFADGGWYTRHRDVWFTGESHRGPWSQADPRSLPNGLRKLPGDYRNRSYEARRVPYGHWDQERERDRPRPPVVRIQRPEHLFLLVRYGVYYVPDKQNEIFFADGGWYTRHRDVWFTGESHRGPWSQADPRSLPNGLRKLPADYRNRSYEARRVPYGHWDKERERARQRPPDVRIQKPEFMYLLTSYGIYYVPDERHEIFFADGSWYTRYRDTWFTGESYRGPWSQADPRNLPNGLRKLPADYRNRSSEARRVPYGHWDKEREREDKRNEEKDVRPDSKPPVREPHKIKESKNGRVPSPGPQEPPLPNPRVEAKPDKRPEKREQAPSRKGSDGKVDKIPRPEVLRYVKKLDVYFIPEFAEEILYFKDAWYLRDKGKWLTSDSFNGPWSLVDKRKVPKRISTLPKDYRSDKYPSQEVPYGHWEGKRKRGSNQK
jgi:hypothetical protein